MLEYVVVALLALVVVLLLGLVLNINKMLRRVSSIRGHIQQQSDSGTGAQLEEAVAQLQSAAVSLDRIALRCDAMEAKLDEIVQRAPSSAGSRPEELAAAFSEALTTIREPLEDIRQDLSRSVEERVREEVKRTLYNQGYDRVEITTDVATLENGDGKVQVEVEREGVKSKGYVVVKDGSVVEQKLSPTYEMFP